MFKKDCGTFEVSPQGEVGVGDITEFKLVYTAGKYGVEEIGGLRISLRLATDITPPQFSDPSGSGYTTIECSRGIKATIEYQPQRGVRPWFKRFSIHFSDTLLPGDTVVVRYGDMRSGGAGVRMQTFCEKEFLFLCKVDLFGTNTYIPVPDTQNLAVLPGNPKTLRAVIPSVLDRDQSFSLRICAQDIWGNICPVPAGKIALSSNISVKGLPENVVCDGKTMPLRVAGLTMEDPGTLMIALEHDTLSIQGLSNPGVQDGLEHRFWGDLHGQSRETVGTNSVRDYFNYARDAACMDICSHQGNDFQITHAFWMQINTLTARFDEPGVFLAIPGYEWSGNSHMGGDHNVYYRQEGEPICRAHKALITDKSIPFTDASDINALFAQMHQRHSDVVINAHVGGRYADLSVGHDSDLQRSVEIHSAWGTFEWILHQAFDLGLRMGVVCASDDHHGRPGASMPGVTLFGAQGGLTCYIMDRLNRDNLFQAMRCRHHYGTTGCRLVLDVHLSGTQDVSVLQEDSEEKGFIPQSRAQMGDILMTGEDTLELSVQVAGTAPIERLDLFDGKECLRTIYPYTVTGSEKRIRLLWHGAECKGRKRISTWNGSLKVRDNSITRIAPINSLNPERQPTLLASGEVVWNAATAGNFSGIDIYLQDAHKGILDIATDQGGWSVPVADILDAMARELGGLGKKMTLQRLPEQMQEREVKQRFRIATQAGNERKLFVRVTQEDGHRAWSSPIYVLPGDLSGNIGEIPDDLL